MLKVFLLFAMLSIPAFTIAEGPKDAAPATATAETNATAPANSAGKPQMLRRPLQRQKPLPLPAHCWQNVKKSPKTGSAILFSPRTQNGVAER